MFTKLSMVCVSILALMLGLIAEQPGLLTLAALLLSIVAAANAWSRRSLARVDSRLSLSRQRLFPGDAVTIAVDVDNAKLLPVWLQAKLPVASALATRALDGSTSLFGFRQATFQWCITPTRRGVHQLGPLQLTAADPLGFFRSTRLEASAELVVYPRLIPLARHAPSPHDFFSQSSARGLVEDPALVSGARDYQHGRAARFIHWKASARHNRIIEKLCEVTEQESVLLLLNVDSFAHDPTGETFERCLEVIAALAEQLEAQRCGFGFISNGRSQGGASSVLTLTRAESRLAQLLEALARAESVPACELSELVQRTGVLALGTTVVCFSYAQDHSTLALWSLVQQRKLASLAVLCGPEPGLQQSPVPVESLRAWCQESPSP